MKLNSIYLNLDSIAVITHNTPKEAQIKYIPSVENQTAISANGIAGKFVVQYDVERDSSAGDVLVSHNCKK